MIIVTGGAGFIGSNLIKELNNKGIEDIFVVDNLKKRPGSVTIFPADSKPTDIP